MRICMDNNVSYERGDEHAFRNLIWAISAETAGNGKDNV